MKYVVQIVYGGERSPTVYGVFESYGDAIQWGRANAKDADWHVSAIHALGAPPNRLDDYDERRRRAANH